MEPHAALPRPGDLRLRKTARRKEKPAATPPAGLTAARIRRMNESRLELLEACFADRDDATNTAITARLGADTPNDHRRAPGGRNALGEGETASRRRMGPRVQRRSARPRHRRHPRRNEPGAIHGSGRPRDGQRSAATAAGRAPSTARRWCGRGARHPVAGPDELSDSLPTTMGGLPNIVGGGRQPARTGGSSAADAHKPGQRGRRPTRADAREAPQRQAATLKSPAPSGDPPAMSSRKSAPARTGMHPILPH